MTMAYLTIAWILSFWQVEITAALLTFSIAYECPVNYYGSACATYCPPQREGSRFVCNQLGLLVCANGWKGERCDQPICSSCGNGRCISPGKCECSPGFSGENCDQCIPAYGCDHGTCDGGKPFTCKCLEGWTGSNCNIEIEYCSRHQPCQNRGVCIGVHKSFVDQPFPVEKPYKCVCTAGFTGPNCERAHQNVCAQKGMCMNGGKCSSLGGAQYRCTCPLGFTGQHCQVRHDAPMDMAPLDADIHPVNFEKLHDIHTAPMRINRFEVPPAAFPVASAITQATVDQLLEYAIYVVPLLLCLVFGCLFVPCVNMCRRRMQKSVDDLDKPVAHVYEADTDEIKMITGRYYSKRRPSSRVLPKVVSEEPGVIYTVPVNRSTQQNAYNNYLYNQNRIFDARNLHAVSRLSVVYEVSETESEPGVDTVDGTVQNRLDNTYEEISDYEPVSRPARVMSAALPPIRHV